MAIIAKKILAKALLDKNTFSYANRDNWGAYTYKDIYHDFRIAFSDYLRQFDHELTDEELTLYFARDYYKKDPKLLEAIFGKNEDQPTATKQSQPIPAQVRSEPVPSAAPPPPRVPAALKSGLANTGSALGRAFQRNFGKHLTFDRVTTGIFGVLGGIGGGVISGGNPLMIAAGAGTGAVGGSYLTSPEGRRSLGNAGNKVINTGINLSNRASGNSWVKGPSKRVWIGALVGFFILFFILGGITTGLPISAPTGEAAPVPGNVGVGSTAAVVSTTPNPSSISNCEFTHQNRTYRVGSTKLQSLIEEVALKSGVPASALAGIALQETANFTAQAKDDNPAFSTTDFPNAGCDPYFPTSITGAMGLMQVQPPANISTYGTNYDPKAADTEGIKIGLSFLGRDLSGLTKNDFCNVRTSLYLGAGVMISKNKGKPPTTSDEIRQAACKYHGTCGAGGYSYADEVKQGFEQCKAVPVTFIASASECPVPNGKALCGSQFTPVNGCGHCGIGYGPMQNCVYPGTKYALDISGPVAQPISLPKVNGAMVQWVYMGSESTIQKYAGTAADSGKKYYLQLHHTQPGSGNVNGGLSGEAGGVIVSGSDHVHVQIGDGGSSQSNTNWLDAAQYFCRKQ